MSKSKQTLLIVVSLLLAISVDIQPSQAEKPYTILDINGEKITSIEAENAWKGLFPENAAPAFDGFDEEVRQNVLRGLVSEHLLYKEAEKADLGNFKYAA